MEQGEKLAIRLLATGHTVAEAAALLECDTDVIDAVQEAYAQQIIDEREQLPEHVTATSTEVAETLTHDQKLHRAEATALEKLEVGLSTETNLMKIGRIFQLLNSAKRRDTGEGLENGPVTIDNRKIVVLNLPEKAIKRPDITVNHLNEVVAVEGQELTIASSKFINELAGLSEENTDENQGVLIEGG